MNKTDREELISLYYRNDADGIVAALIDYLNEYKDEVSNNKRHLKALRVALELMNSDNDDMTVTLSKVIES